MSTSAMNGQPAGGSVPPVGTVAEETARLLRVLRSDESGAHREDVNTWRMPSVGAGSSAGSGAAGGTGTAGDKVEGEAAHAPDCTWCPLCRGIAIVRRADPESIDRLLEGATLLASALVDLATQLTRPPSPPSPAEPAAPRASDRAGQRTRASTRPPQRQEDDSTTGGRGGSDDDEGAS